eukprot:6491228-Amphidinium_carterae.2
MAFPHDAERIAILQTFAASGYAQQATDGSWRLTNAALTRICTGTAYIHSGDLFALDADVDTKAVLACSDYEVLKLLHLAGWKRQGLPQKARRKEVQPILREGVLQKKVYYGTFHRKYAEHGILNIRHFLPEASYDRLLRGSQVEFLDHDDADFLQDDLAVHVVHDNWADELVHATTEPSPQEDPDTTEFDAPIEEMPALDDDDFLRGLEEALENYLVAEVSSDMSDGYDDIPPPAPVSAHEHDGYDDIPPPAP